MCGCVCVGVCVCVCVYVGGWARYDQNLNSLAL